MIAKNGEPRATTLRDARKLGLLPSVTSITALLARPGLERWKAEQVLMAGLTLPRLDGEPEAEWVKRVWQDSREQARKAAKRGTSIHAAIERSYRGEAIEHEWEPFVEAARTSIDLVYSGEQWRPERSFASPWGYGGKVDLHSDRVILDIKTKDRLDGEVYDEHLMQLAAYATGLGMRNPRAGIVFVLANEDTLMCRVKPQAMLVEVEPADLARGGDMFRHLLALWYSKTGLKAI